MPLHTKIGAPEKISLDTVKWLLAASDLLICSLAVSQNFIISYIDLHANADLLFLLILFFFFPFFVPATGPLTRYLKTGCSESDQTWQSGRSP